MNSPLKVVSVRIGECQSHFYKHAIRTLTPLGVNWETVAMPVDTSRNEILMKIGALNSDPSVHGIMIMKPVVSSHLSISLLQQSLHPHKDIEGMHPTNLGKIVYGQQDTLWPVTAKAAIEVLCSMRGSLQGSEVLVIGTSDVLAKPITSLLHAEGATVTVCCPSISNLAAYSRSADIVITAVSNGIRFSSEGMFKPGCVVIDLGSNLNSDGLFVGGDVDMRACKISKFASLTHGVGVVRTSVLVNNLVRAVELQLENI